MPNNSKPLPGRIHDCEEIQKSQQTSNPRFLYRYRPINENSLQEIAFNTVYVCPFDKLNDPREGGFRTEKSDSLRERLIDQAIKDGENEIALVLHLASKDDLAELEQQILNAGGDHLDARRNWGVVCFTERYDNMAMWAHYADNSRGVAIEYDLARITIPDGALRKVRYVDELGGFSADEIFDPSNSGRFSELIAHKQCEWAYEEEWRLLGNEVGVRKLTIPISRVITGVQTPADKKTKVVNAIRRHRSARFAELIIERGSDRGLRLHDPTGG
jgi:hypothetical protein